MSARVVSTIAAILLCNSYTVAQAQTERWAPVQFLIGDWVGEGSGKPGDSTSTFSFAPDLQNAALIRRAHSDYPATSERPVFAHDDILVLYPTGGTNFGAFYYDNEGHAISYRASVAVGSATFISDPVAGQPRFKLTYSRTATDRLHIEFAIAPPNKPTDFQVYVAGDAHRK
jgi:hypothetical protein